MVNDKSNTLSCMLINGSKNEKFFFFWCILILVPGTVTLKTGHKIHLCGFFSWIHFICLTPFFRDGKAASLDEGICFPNNICHGNQKKTIFQRPYQWLWKMFHQKNKNLADTKSWFDWISTRQDKKTQAEKRTFCDKKPKS